MFSAKPIRIPFLATALFLLALAWTPSNAASPPNIPNFIPSPYDPISDVPDFTAGDPIGTTHDWNLGPTGARGWMWGWLLSTDLARQIYVTSVAAGSPAASGNTLKAGDVILGINGALFTSDARIALGNAITEAEKTANNGVLRLTRWRAGITSTVTINLPVKGDYATLSPVACAKSTAVMQSACQYIVNKGLNKDIQGYMNALGLLATGNTQYNSTLRTYARSLVPNTYQGAWNWDAAYMNLFLCEYYLATGDTAVLPEINQLCLFLANGQSVVGSWGHSPKNPNGMIAGYGALNSVGLVCAISLELGRKCGVNDPAVNLAVTRAADFFRRFVGCGAIPYGDHAPMQMHDDNGKNSMAAVFYDLIGEAGAAAYYSRMTVASYARREFGHTGNFWSYIWGPLGAQRSGDAAAAAFLREQYWFYDLERRWDGGFTYQGGADRSGSEHTTPDYDTTGARVLMYAMPLKKLYITGKSPSVAPALTGTDLDKTILSGRDFSVWYAVNRLSREAYDDLTDAELLARLDTWSCEQRDRAARALGRRTSPPITDYRNMVKSTNRDTILGGLYGLRYMGTAALPALADVQPLLTHEDLWIQFQAGKVMCAIGAPARDVAAPIESNTASSATAANDPRQFRQRFAAYNLWGNNGLDDSSLGIVKASALSDLDPSLLIPAVRKTIRHEHSVPRKFVAEWLDLQTFSGIEPFLFDIRYGVETQAPTCVMFNHESRDKCLAILQRNNFKETVDAAATYVETMKNHGAETRMGEVMNVLVSFGTEAQRVLPRLYAARTFYQQNWGPGKPYDFPQWALDMMMASLNNGITAIENATTAPANLKTIYDYSIAVLTPPSASPNRVDVGASTTLSITAFQGEDLPITYSWSKVSGPGTVNFATPNASQTTATFSAAGIYEVCVTMQDAYRTKTATVQVVCGGQLACELRRLDLTANGGINPATGRAWQMGDTYRLVFVSSAGTTAQSTDLATYDTFVQGLATTAGLGAGNWKVIGSSSTEDARDHTATNPNTNGSGEALILADGSTVIANNYADLWDGSLDAPINVTEKRTANPASNVFTGTYNNGTKESDTRYFGGSNETPPKTTTGRTDYSNTYWTRNFCYSPTTSFPVYAISKVLRVGASFPPEANAGPDQETKIIDSPIVPWTPSQLTTAAWYDAADATKVQTSGSAVTNWLDKSGNGLNLSQANTTLQPATGATINSLNAINFTGDMMATSSNPFGTTINDAFVIAVHKVDAVTGGTFFSLSGSTNRWQSHAPWSDGNLYFDCGGTSSPNRVSAAYGVSAGSVALTSFYDSNTDQLQQVFKNGTLLAGDSSGHAVTTGGNITVGGIDTSYQDTTIGEFIIIKGTVDLATRQKLEGYLAHKWGLTANLPANHPYKSSAPTSGGPTATVNLGGTVTDPDDTSFITTWNVLSTDPSGLGVQFGNASSANTIATFTQPGTYTLRFTASDGANAPVSDDIIVTVKNDTTVWIAATDAAASEPGTDTGTFTVTRSGVTTGTTTVNLGVTGTATSGNDYTALPSTVTFAAGETTKTITVTPVNDTSVEGNETVIVTLATGTGYTVAATPNHTATVTIADDDLVASVSISATDAAASEPGTNTGTFTVTRSGVTTGTTTVNLTVTGTATSGSDYTALPSTVTFAAGETTKTLTVTPLNDTIVEGNEAVILTLAAGTGYTVAAAPNNSATVTIADDDVSVSIAATDATASEPGTDTGTFMVTRSGVTTGSTTVNLTVTGTATSGSDYTALATTVTFAVGETSKTITVTPVNDTNVEGNETVIVTLAAGTGYTVASAPNNSATVTIADDDVGLSISATDAAASEPGTNTGTFTVTRSGVTTGTTTVNLTVTGSATSGSDYTALPSTVAFAAGETTKTITVTPLDDTSVEGNETVIVTLATGTGYTVAAAPNNAATVTIADDDSTPPTVNAGADQTVYGTMKPWTPALIPTAGWFDGSDPTTITASGGKISKINDKSGNNRHLTQATGTQQPTLSTWQGLSAIQIVNTGASGDRLASATNIIADADDFTIVSVLQGTSLGRGADTFGAGWSIQVREPASNVVLTSGGAVGYGATAPVSGSLQTTLLDQGVSLKRSTYGGTFTTTATPKTTLRSSTRLFEFGTSNGSSLAGYIGEVIICTSILSQADYQKLEGYLAHKWGFANNLPAAHPYRYAPPMTSSMATVVTLSGSVTDPDGPSLTSTWSLVSTVPSGLTVQFGNASSTNTTATFTQPGTYTLRLTGNDTVNTPVSDEIVITVCEALPTLYSTWGNTTFNTTFSDKAIGSNPDGDSRNNLLEFAFGTDPTLTDMGPLATDGTRHGDPAAVAEAGGGFALYFLRRIDHGTTGSATYTACFSSDLGTFYDNDNATNPPVEVATSTKDPNYKVVKVPFPTNLPNSQPAKFGRVKVTATP